ncbi:sarcosine oxidase subunit gamma family protein [Manganibacter manganicus]|uniref:Sarcosine oxidase subunit gamma n=1 Tax=Manganibacter manganicus TaxID=1873176 RepID=A0A1V8RWD1_9HYPH|nr:sarcosine oxidase subunit gamma [Pseudaminobacter manganicus]OQM77463.1 sarcosine oxidase subunit gamma [Pseudaminobacter manganicus]
MASRNTVERLSPLEPVYQPGLHGQSEHGAGVTLCEAKQGSILQLTAWPGEEKRMIAAIRSVARLAVPDGAGGGIVKNGKAAFGIAPGKFTVTAEEEGLAEAFAASLKPAIGTVTDLSHGRTIIRISGEKAEWVLAKLFAIDFSLPAFPIGAGRSTVHHDIFAQIQRTDNDSFDIHVFRSFARAFWKLLCHSSEEVGYEVQ